MVKTETRIRHYLLNGKALPYRSSSGLNKAMLTGKELGAALAAAIALKRVTKKAVADHFHVRPPSVQDWVNHGRIGKQHLNELVAYFSDVVAPSHWGMANFEPSHLLPGVTSVTAFESGVNPSAANVSADVKTPLLDRAVRLSDQILATTKTGLLDERGLAQLEENLRAFIGAAASAPGKEVGKRMRIAPPGELRHERRTRKDKGSR